MTATAEAKVSASNYLRHTLGSRKDCDVLQDVEEEVAEVVIEELACAFDAFARQRVNQQKITAAPVLA